MVELNPQVPRLWSVNALLSGRSRSLASGPHEGTLSVKTVVSGHCVYRTRTKVFRLQPGVFTVLPEGRAYELEISRPCETLSVFFRPGFLQEVEAAATGIDLDSPEVGSARNGFAMPERLEAAPSRLHSLALRLQSALKMGEDPMLAETLVLEAAREVASYSTEAQRESESLGYARLPVRQEAFRRLNRARDLLIDEMDKPLRLADLAREACLSPSQFHFLFRSAFGVSPHAFLTARRVDRAVLLLGTTDWPLWSIASAVGFKSESHLCRLVARATGRRTSELRSVP